MKLVENTMREAYWDHLTTPIVLEDGSLKAPCSLAVKEALFSKFCEQKNKSLETFLNSHEGSIYWWSDQHFGHENIIKYCARPFENKDEMSEKLFENYCQKVTPSDLVIFGGDFMMANKERGLHFLRKMPGKKIQVLGNHDFGHKKKELFYLFEDSDFDYVVDSLTVEENGVTYFVSHYPLRSSLIPKGVKNIHGHIHDMKIKGDLHLNMSSEIIGYKPVDLVELISANKAYCLGKEINF